MTFASIVLYLALIVFMVFRRVAGRPVTSIKQLFLLPVIVSFLGFESLHHASLNGIDVAVVAVGSALSLGLGALRGCTDKVSQRDGAPWVRWGAASVAVFAVNLVIKLVLDVGTVLIGGTGAGVSSSLVFAIGLMMLGEAGVVWLRVQGQLSPISQPTSRW